MLITPERVLFSGEVEAVVLRADGADTTFLANHMDYIGAVDICVLRLAACRRRQACRRCPRGRSSRGW